MVVCGGGFSPPPTRISARAFTAAAVLMREYFVPMAARVYGENTVTASYQNAATLARWILHARPREARPAFAAGGSGGRAAHRRRNPCRGRGANPPRLSIAGRADPAFRFTSSACFTGSILD